MWNWQKWIWPGVLTTVLLTALAMLMKSGSIQEDLQSRCLEGNGWASIAADGRDLTITGTAPSEEARDGALETARKCYGTRVAKANIDLLPVEDTFTLSAVRENGKITLEGFVPDEATRSEVAAAANALGAGDVVDNLKLARGAPEGFGALAGFGISQLGHLTAGKAALSGSDLSITGIAASSEDYEAAISALSGEIPGNGKLAEQSITPVTVSPYTFAASTKAGEITLEGQVPTPEARTAIVSHARELNPDGTVVDRLVVANGVPDGIDWTNATRFAVDQASQLLEGKASIEDGTYSIDGMAKSNGSFDSLKSATASPLGGGLNLGGEQVSRPVIKPYVWSFTNVEGGEPVLSGYVPEEAASQSNDSEVTAALGTARKLENKLEVGEGAPENFGEAARIGIHSASRLANGKASISGTTLTIEGEALSDLAARQIREELEKGLPAGFKGVANVTVRKPESLPILKPDMCQQAMTGELKSNTIRFETNEATIDRVSYGLLDRLSFAVKRCPTAIVEISGHTDSDGSDEYNQALSERRANAVRSYLVSTGVFAGRLEAAGYGETRPVGDNATEEGKAQNRRIEFKVVQ